jgi:hypothetical protein
MNTKTFTNARFTPKGDIEANWNKAVGFVPLDREIIIYKADENYSTARIKVGDGVTPVQDLPFVTKLPNIPTKLSELENDSNFITEQYYKDNREFYDDRAVSKTFTLQTILNPAAGFTQTAKNDSYDFFSNLGDYYKTTQHNYRDWYAVDRLAVSYDKGEWLNFESGEDYLILAACRDDSSRCELSVYNHAGDKLLWCNGTLRDAEGNVSYDWGFFGLNTDLIPIPDISGLDIINLDFAF